jgi:YidC/Oxa1 family membrane protein insertase
MDNIRLILAVVLSMLVLLVYQYFFVQPPTKPPQKKDVTREAEQEKPKSVPESRQETQPETQEQEKKPVVEFVPPVVDKSDVTVKDIVIDTDLYHAVLTTRGGSIKSWKLKTHKDTKGAAPVLLRGQGVIPPLGIVREGQDAEALLWVNYNTTLDNMEHVDLTKGKDIATVEFFFKSGAVFIKKIFTFYKDKYKVDFTVETEGIPSFLLALGTDFGIFMTNEGRAHHGPVLLRYSERDTYDKGDLKEPTYVNGGVQWIAQEDKYFAAALAPLKMPANEKNAKIWETGNDINIAFELSSGKKNFLLYAGPKEYDRLVLFNLKLEHLIDFGWDAFEFIAFPLFRFLKFLYSYLGNYGLTIIILTIIVRLPFIPLISKGQRTMKKMQVLQPKIVELKERYKNDPQKLNTEMIELYKKHKANPLGGCLPMVIQIPVFFALYNVLQNAIELRGAPFYFWITDLSAKDPYYILPLIMGGTMLLQQKMTPSTADPQQQKIMMLMPVVFTFLFLTFPSGLVLYWLVNNVLAIIQQYYINKSA